jgi:hypothetical protein
MNGKCDLLWWELQKLHVGNWEIYMKELYCRTLYKVFFSSLNFQGKVEIRVLQISY